MKKTRKILGMHPAAFNISYKTYNPLADIIIIIIIINYYRLTLYCQWLLGFCIFICLKIENAKVITRGRTFMSVRCYEVIHQVALRSTSA